MGGAPLPALNVQAAARTTRGDTTDCVPFLAEFTCRFPSSQGYVAVDLGLRFPGEKYAGLTSLTAHDATVSYELFL